jgi:hypothetical protein
MIIIYSTSTVLANSLLNGKTQKADFLCDKKKPQLHRHYIQNSCVERDTSFFVLFGKLYRKKSVKERFKCALSVILTASVFSKGPYSVC